MRTLIHLGFLLCLGAPSYSHSTPPHCYCPIMPMPPRYICGTDRETYYSECDFNCRSPKGVGILFYGRCNHRPPLVRATRQTYYRPYNIPSYLYQNVPRYNSPVQYINQMPAFKLPSTISPNLIDLATRRSLQPIEYPLIASQEDSKQNSDIETTELPLVKGSIKDDVREVDKMDAKEVEKIAPKKAEVLKIGPEEADVLKIEAKESDLLKIGAKESDLLKIEAKETKALKEPKVGDALVAKEENKDGGDVTEDAEKENKDANTYKHIKEVQEKRVEKDGKENPTEKCVTRDGKCGAVTVSGGDEDALNTAEKEILGGNKQASA